ncbi:MAG: maleylacetoacetate isomerase [Pseudobdellovibrionaceae bacterium]
MEKPILYSYFRSSSAYRVRIALHVKGIHFDYRAVHLLKDGGEQHKSDFKNLNPQGQVPCLVHHDHAIGQSVAIIEYLDEVQPHPPLFPSSPYEKAKVRQVCEMFNSGVQPLHNLAVTKYIEENYSPKKPMDKDAWTVHWMMEGYAAIEKVLSQTAGNCCFGDRVSAADAFLAPAIFSAARFGCPLDSFPTMTKINAHLNELDAFKKAHPFKQPDTPDELRK